jgi:hypothetical protein
MKSPRTGTDSDELHVRLAEALEAYEKGGSAAVESLCERHPHLAAALRQRVQGLAALGLLDELSGDGPPPERLGDFVPLRRLGGGGMGVVYLARQESLGREVALKLIRPDQLHLPGARERFRREVETVARLQHPGIVPVYAVGEERGVPFLAMERVDGSNLSDAIAALAGRDPAALGGADLARAVREDARELSWVFAGTYAEACTRLVQQAAEALEHAHRRGVMHRDLKPSNLMVTPDGRALLLDFGLASYEGSDRLTRTGSQLGSLAYMAPEHLRSGQPPADARGDVYGLGVTLYELLALRSPFAGDSSESTRIAVLSADPPRLSTANRAVSWELETVCMKAMEADPARRYASAAGFARDLGNVLEGRPIEARRAGAWLRARRWVQRHPTASVAALAGVLVAVVGPTLFAVQQAHARAQLQVALDETEAQRARAAALAEELLVQRDAAQAEGARAEGNLTAALSAVDVMLARVGDRTLRQVPQMDAVRRGLFEDALAFYEDLLEQRAGSEASLDELELRLKLATLELDFDETASASARLEDLLERIERASPDARAGDALEFLRGRTLNSLAGVRYHGGDMQQGLADFRESVGILRAGAEGEHATPSRRITAAIATANLGLALWQQSAPREEVLEVCDAALQLRTAILSEQSDRPAHLVEIAHIEGMRARCLTELGRLDEARAAAESGVQVLREVLEQRPGSRDVRTRIVTAAVTLAYILDNQGRLEQAVELLSRARPTSEALVRDFPDDRECFQDSLLLGVNLAGALAALGRLADAELLLRETLARVEPRVAGSTGPNPYVQLVAAIRVNLAEILLTQGRAEESLEAVERSIDELQRQSRAGWQGTAQRELQRGLGAALTTRATVTLHTGEHAPAREDLAAASSLVAGDARAHYQLALGWVRCAAAVDQDGELSEQGRVGLLEECYGKALDSLRGAAAAGWSDAAILRENSEWEPLRGMPEFEALLEELQRSLR